MFQSLSVLLRRRLAGGSEAFGLFKKYLYLRKEKVLVVWATVMFESQDCASFTVGKSSYCNTSTQCLILHGRNDRRVKLPCCLTMPLLNVFCSVRILIFISQLTVTCKETLKVASLEGNRRGEPPTCSRKEQGFARELHRALHPRLASPRQKQWLILSLSFDFLK